MEKIKIICVVGATASGKTALGVALARALGGEVISADSMQVYRGMPIATAAATPEEQQGVPHHLLAFLAPEERFSVADFVALAKQTAYDIHRRGHVPIVVGGTGLFIDSLVENITFSDVGIDDDLRKSLQEKDTETLYQELLQADKAAAETIHKNNRKRVIRALELYYGGVSKTQQNAQSVQTESPFEALYIGVDYRNRDMLYARIHQRVDVMIAQGLAEEARRVYNHSGITARQAIGHKELLPYLQGQCSLEEAVENLKKATRHYAKRQLTWFRKNTQVQWLFADEMPATVLQAQALDMANRFLEGVE